ncbi:hypothetical protein AZE42_11926 [Rhizopogon vesiculosus]|uniref:Uncharacterized protein n=1 Tax=Rhizopogon vesiculosus TaxID=180088 RepID=A0A1J8QMS4_9AGAM|nr:hypothetical protein AZE42_11926 [Rhizopogon vesiculosus]
MNVGLAATYIAIEDIDPKAYDPDDKPRRVDNSTRKDLEVQLLLNFLDHPRLETVLSLQWLLTLTRYIPELVTIKSHITMLYRTRAANRHVRIELLEIPSSCFNFGKSTQLRIKGSSHPI